MIFAGVRTLIYMTAFAVLWGYLALQVRGFDERIGLSISEWVVGVGAVLMAGGSILALTCGWFFALRGRGTPALFDAPREFVATGPYRYVRNPMYIGGFFILLGFGFVERSVSIIIFSLLWFVFFHLLVVFVEEPGLMERFGESYGKYRSTVNRWIPKRRGQSAE